MIRSLVQSKREQRPSFLPNNPFLLKTLFFLAKFQTATTMAAAPQANRQPAGFFRVILPPIPYQKKLDLPLKFVVTYGAQLSSTATFNLPNGDVWKIGVKKGTEGRTAWFSKNWGRFVDHYSISLGFFLVFQYLGGSEFNVKIFNLTCCSIPAAGGHGVQPIRRGRAQPISVNHVASSADEEEEENEDHAGEEAETLLNRLKESGIATGWLFGRKNSKLWLDSKKGIEAAILSKPPDRPCFLILITSALIRGKSMATIPSPFVAEHIDGEWQSAKLQVQGKKQWEVDLRKVKNSGLIYMVSGWKQFSVDNGLEVGDVCLFQLVSPAEPVLEVSVFPAAK